MNGAGEQAVNAADRVSILSVPADRIKPHFWTFSIGFTAHLAFNIYANITDVTDLPWRKLPSAIIADTVPAIGFWLVFSAILVEGINMVFAAIYRQKNRERARLEGREEGREEGRTESDAAWREWNQRRLDAEGCGESFDEPPPNFSDGGSGSSR